MKMSVWSLACRQSVFQWYHCEKHLSEFYPQDGGESQLALKLRHCHSMYIVYNRVKIPCFDTCTAYWLNRQAWRQAAAARVRSGRSLSTSRRSELPHTKDRRRSGTVWTTASRRPAASPSTSRWTTFLRAAGRTSTPVASSTTTPISCPEPISIVSSTGALTQPVRKFTYSVIQSISELLKWLKWCSHHKDH